VKQSKWGWITIKQRDSTGKSRDVPNLNMMIFTRKMGILKPVEQQLVTDSLLIGLDACHVMPL
jgi:hypothetical protein